MKRLFALIAVLALVFTACATTQEEPAMEDKAMNEETMAEEIMLTLEELAQYNGQNGQPAYVAHEGIIYDVTNVGAWKEGKHNGVMAGTDITEAIKKAPHGVKNLKLAEVIGKIIE